VKKLLIGCAVAVGLCVVVLVVGGILVGSWVRGKLPDTKELEQMQVQLHDRFGTPESFVPPLDGVPSRDRIEQFVAVRESLATHRANAAANLATFMHVVKRTRPEGRPVMEKIIDALSVAKGGTIMASSMVEYFHTRDRLLLASQMGEGEYCYLYGLTSFAWLQWDPLSKPEVREALERVEFLNEVENARSRYGKLVARQLDNTRQALEAKAARTPAEEAALGVLRTELDAASRTDRFPFLGQVPAAASAAFEPYRARLQATLPQDPAEIALDLLRNNAESHGRIRWSTHSTGGVHVSD
jgi:hypothetical protein